MLEEHWQSARIVTRGRVHQAGCLPGFVAVAGAVRVGLVTYQIENEACEVVSLNSLEPQRGVGTALLEAVLRAGRGGGCRRVWAITTNDNLAALRFYQKRGWRLVAIHRNALAASRRLKPEIPLVGSEGIALHDEIEVEKLL